MDLSGFFNLIGLSRQPVSHREKLISMTGGFLGILGILLASGWLLEPEIAVVMTPSMGATAVLLFAAPHATFSQPWNAIIGHTVSAIVGVTCWQWIPDLTFAASASVGLAIGAMFITRSIHPPGGATALAAVIGAENLHHLGYSYVLQPVLFNVLSIAIVAMLYNYLFHWRQYPAHLHDRKQASEPTEISLEPIKHEDFVFALSQIETMVDIDEEDLLKIYNLATKRHVKQYRNDAITVRNQA